MVDLIGKGGHIRTVPIPNWVKAALDQWTRAANIREGKIFRRVRPFPPEASAALLPPPLLRLLPGGAIQFPGGPFIPLWTSAFHGAL